MSGNVTVKKVVTHPYFSLLCFVSLCFLLPLLPRYGGIAVMVGSAGVLSVYVAALPESFRSRSGSMTTAFCLVAALWLGAAVTTVMTLMGEIQG